MVKLRKIVSGLKSQESKKTVNKKNFKLKRLPNLQFKKIASVVLSTLVATPLSVQAGEEAILSQPDPAFNLKVIAENVLPGFKASFGLTKRLLMGSDDSDSESDSETELDSDSDFPTDDEIWDSPFKCKPITEEVEKFVEDNVDSCIPLEDQIGNYGGVIKNMIKTAKTDDDCITISAFGQVVKNAQEIFAEETNRQCPIYLLVTTDTCLSVCYWCCCNVLEQVSPVIAKATINLLV